MSCPNCRAPVGGDARFCSRCGAAMPVARLVGDQKKSGKGRKRTDDLPANVAPPERPSPAQLAKLKAAAEAMVDGFLVECGLEDPASLTDDAGRRHFVFGSARCRAAVVEEEGELYLHADALVMELPSDKDLIVPLMRELLELNLRLRGAVRVGISGELVIAMASRPVLELQVEEFSSSLFNVIAVADNIDDALQAKYSGTTKQRAPSGGASGKG